MSQAVNQKITKKLTQRQMLLLSDICLILVAAVWGSSYGFAKLSLQYYPVLGFLAIRFGLTSLLLSPVLIATYQNNTAQLTHTLKAGVPLGAILLAIFLFETYGLVYTSVANAAFLISLCIVMTPFMEWLILKNRPHTLVFICAILSLFGTYLLTLSSGVSMGDSSAISLNLGDGLILLAALARAVMVTMTKKLTQNTINVNNKPDKQVNQTNQTVSSLALTAVQSIIVFIGCLGLFLVSNALTGKLFIPSLPNGVSFWLPTLYLVIFCTLFAFFVQNWAVKIGTPSRASLLMGSEPVFGALFAVVLFNEQVGALGWIGGGLITLASGVLVARGR